MLYIYIILYSYLHYTAIVMWSSIVQDVFNQQVEWNVICCHCAASKRLPWLEVNENPDSFYPLATGSEYSRVYLGLGPWFIKSWCFIMIQTSISHWFDMICNSCFAVETTCIYIYTYIPRTQLASIFEGQPSKTRPKLQSKQGSFMVIWVLGIYTPFKFGLFT